MSKEPRRDSKLGNLPEEQRKQVLHWFKQCGWESCLVRIRTELGISSNRDSLYKALERWRAEARNNRFLAIARAQVDLEERASGDRMTPEQREEAIDRHFIVQASQAETTEEYMDLRYMQIAARSARTKAQLEALKLQLKERQIEQKSEALKLDREKFEFDAAKAALTHVKELRSIARDSSLTEDQKIERVQLRLFGAPPETMKGKAS